MNDTMNPKWWIAIIVLIGCFVFSQIVWGGFIRPGAEAIMASGTIALTNVFVILKDMEQQICFALMVFCMYLMFYKLMKLTQEEAFYKEDFLESHPKDEPLNIEQALNELQASKYRDTPAMATWIDCLRRYKNTENVQHAADAINNSVDSIANKLESGNSMIRFIIWAIPSIGFIGTVRGIGQALAQADQALQGDIAGMTASLGVAFNSTLVALFISIILMFLMHLLNQRQDAMVIATQHSCETNLLTHLHH